jgi:hypothetical protein
MYLTRRHLKFIIGGSLVLVILLALTGCGVMRDLPRYW